MKTWYIRNNDEHLGPYSIEELRLLGVYSDDYVWKEGLPQWTKASTLEELQEMLITVEHSIFPTDASPNSSDVRLNLHEKTSKMGLKETLTNLGKNFFSVFKKRQNPVL